MSQPLTPTTAAPALPRLRLGRGAQRFMRNRGALIGAGVVLLFVLLAIFAPLLTPYDPAAPNYSAIRQGPSWAHIFGTDQLGRDQFTRIAYGARASLAAGMVSVLVAVILGVPIGLIAGYFGGFADMVISRFAEALLAIPSLILAISLAAFLGPSLTNAMIAIGVAATPIFIRLTRGQVLVARTEDFVEGARAIGLPHVWIILRYIMPNVLAPIVVQATITVATAIIAEASLSFLGIGIQPPTPSWGSMLNTAKDFLMQAPWMSAFPGIAIFMTVLGFNLLGDGLRDALDPRS
ncbi:ABC transporter permease [Ketogulonicigenium vulgare]|uniref:Dipeptide transport system permease protein n=1 Tax=Ketogulonicigenium vulgare (strain WSH-001) TaxID=759362 RepID=F9Y954_KETVW|nr:ABC transporter permease [Ketogulonicigenium vulgare]ADO43091.1 binding-protein-dependent transport systems inner membrane component [Ketogulonicigenium vulgare Y25]AEM41271.1 Dipeptide transport system permease protein [Ketogulonicigenium vulgare WSH-001]ALJ81409.1 diguanylate cyclase [Ketogulonicigenium vulgare]ANW34135.1 diguanylate cyclase [Ketogulonicigenium vulgare]AOZ55004.1 binding-protein-dependent transporters inner membrane component [Ketogulonicigenium vulgare]